MRDKRAADRRATRTYYDRNRDEVLRKRAIYHSRNREFVDAYLRSHPCVDCGETDRIVLTFDHVRGEKVSDVSAMIQSRSLVNIADEIAKCEVRCCNCHMRAEYYRRVAAKESGAKVQAEQRNKQRKLF